MPRPLKLRFIDLFAGCGGLSLGLFQAGLKGIFGVEVSDMAFGTLQENLLGRNQPRYDWPKWLEKRAWDIGELLDVHRRELKALGGAVDLVCGGPPCQGFSFYGKRKRDDARNRLVSDYVRFVRLVRPKYLLLENVRGFDVPHGKKARALRQGKDKGRPTKAFSQDLFEKLANDYVVDSCLLSSADFGVPQARERFFAIGVRRDTGFAEQTLSGWGKDLVWRQRLKLLKRHGLPDRPITAREALVDLETDGLRRVIEYTREGNCRSPSGFQMIDYQPDSSDCSEYVNAMRDGLNVLSPTGLRLARHSDEVRSRFSEIIRSVKKGRRLNEEDRAAFGIRKLRTVPLDGERPAHCITTLPDDILHYSEPRILTVRESARLQSFPDWYNFMGKYTTGGPQRRDECPRYTQVGNAVPPFLAEAWGLALRHLSLQLEAHAERGC